ncbi:MAG: NAD(P)-dependent oxidoreductase [Pseudomonadota bacterium]
MSNLFPLFPVFLDLAGRAVVLLDGEEGAAPLARQFLAAGASVTVFDPAPSDAMRTLAPPVRLKLRRWKPADLTGARLVIAGPNESRPQRVLLAAHAVGAAFHWLGAGEQSDIALGGVSARGALSFGVSAPGVPAAVTDAVQARLEDALPEGFSDFLDAVQRAHAEVERALPDTDARDRFWTVLAKAAFAEKLLSPAQWDAFIAARLGG